MEKQHRGERMKCDKSEASRAKRIQRRANAEEEQKKRGKRNVTREEGRRNRGKEDQGCFSYTPWAKGPANFF